MTLDRLDLLDPAIEIELANEAPDHPRLRIGVKTLIERSPTEFDLIAFRDAKPRLSSTRLASGLSGSGIGKVVGVERKVGHENLAIVCECERRLRGSSMF